VIEEGALALLPVGFELPEDREIKTKWVA